MIEEARKYCGQYWNPIGVPMRKHNNTGRQNQSHYLPEDEYDTYLGKVLWMIERRLSDNEIMAYLTKVETEYLMLDVAYGDKAVFLKHLRAAVR